MAARGMKSVDTSLAPSRMDVSSRQAHRWARRMWGKTTCLVYWVGPVCKADAPGSPSGCQGRLACRRGGRKSNSGATKNRRDVEVDFVEEASIQALLDGVTAVDPNGLPGGFCLAH